MNPLTIPVDTRVFDYPGIALPPVWTVRQKATAPVLENVEGTARDAVAALFAADERLRRPGASVAVGVGSRGISNYLLVVQTVVAELKARGCQPFLVPAMGSHGGATAPGQVAVLAEYGITETSVSAPIRATMDTVTVGRLDDAGLPIYFDAHAHAADAVILVNRIKPHTDFGGRIESGIGKMCAIGLGKQRGAESIHNFGADGLRHLMPRVARQLVETQNIVGGVALIENPYGQTAEIHAIVAGDVAGPGEEALLGRARALMPRIPFDTLDVLVVDEMGKDISGSGLDPHVVGRVRMPSIPETDWDGPNVRMVCCLDLTDHSNGNAAGLGLADVVTRRLIERIDWATTTTNFRTAGEGSAHRMRLPIVLEDAPGCVRAAMGLCGRGDMTKIRLARVRSTKYVDVLEVSPALLGEVRAASDLEIIADAHALDLAAALRAPQPR